MKRSSGILMHITSLPSPYGIGSMGKSAFDFIDFLKKAGQTYWQILPINPPGYGDSPYQAFSTFAACAASGLEPLPQGPGGRLRRISRAAEVVAR